MLIDGFLNYLRFERNYSDYTVESYAEDLNQFKMYVEEHQEGAFNPDEIDSSLVRSWLVCLMNAKYSPSSVNRKLSSLKSFFKYLMKQNVVSVNPLRLINGPKNKKRLPYFIKDEDLEQLLDGDGFGDDFEGIRNRAILEMLYDTGIRRSELVGIRNVDIDYDAMLLKVTGKRNKQRLIPFAKGLKDLMQAYEKTRDQEFGQAREGDCFFVRKNGEPLSAGIVYYVVKKQLSAIPMLSKRSPHVLRHSFATSMLNNGAGLNAVKDLLGHSSLASTSVYTHTSFEELKKVYHAHPRAKKEEVIMDVRIQAIHFDASAQLEAFIQKKVSKLEQYFDGILMAEVVLKVVKPETANNKQVSMKLSIKNGECFADKVSDTFEEAVDDCVEALEKQLVKFKEKNRAK